MGLSDGYTTNNNYVVSLYSLFQFHGGSITKGSELQVEVAEFLWRNVQVLELTFISNYIFRHSKLHTYS